MIGGQKRGNHVKDEVGVCLSVCQNQQNRHLRAWNVPSIFIEDMISSIEVPALTRGIIEQDRKMAKLKNSCAVERPSKTLGSRKLMAVRGAGVLAVQNE